LQINSSKLQLQSSIFLPHTPGGSFPENRIKPNKPNQKPKRFGFLVGRGVLPRRTGISPPITPRKAVKAEWPFPKWWSEHCPSGRIPRAVPAAPILHNSVNSVSHPPNRNASQCELTRANANGTVPFLPFPNFSPFPTPPQKSELMRANPSKGEQPPFFKPVRCPPFLVAPKLWRGRKGIWTPLAIFRKCEHTRTYPNIREQFGDLSPPKTPLFFPP
jgi:hypothetical protein